MLGKFLEVSLHAPDILDSVAFWERLGFRQVSTNEAWTHPYALLSDGRACIGLHARESTYPALTFVRRDLARHLSRLRDAGVEFEYARTADDQFNEAGFLCPDGQCVTLLESRTFSPPPFHDIDFSLLGRFEGFLLPVRDIGRSLPFWARIGLAVLDYREGTPAEAELTDGAFVLMLTDDPALRAPALAFRGDPDTAAPLIAQRTGVAGTQQAGGWRFMTPERIPVVVRHP